MKFMIISMVPWKTVQVKNNTSEKEKNSHILVDLDKLEKLVNEYLSQYISDKLWDYCEVKEQQGWIKDWMSVGKSNPLSYKKYVSSAPYICFTGAQYIAELFTTDPNKWNKLRDKNLLQGKYKFKDLNIKDFPNKLGVWYFDLEHNYEAHSFVLYIKDDVIILYNTYGGLDKVIIREYDREYWSDLFMNFFECSLEDQRNSYYKLWGIPKKNVAIAWDEVDEKLELESLKCCPLYDTLN